MSSGEPLLHSSSFQKNPQKPPDPLIPLSCLCPNSSFSSSSYEDCGSNSNSFRVSDGEELISFKNNNNNNKHHYRDESDLSSRVTTGRFQSADSHFFDSFKSGYTTEDKSNNNNNNSDSKPSHKVSRSIMDNNINNNSKPAALEISSSQAKQERNKSQRMRHKSTQFKSGQLKSGPLEDPFSPEYEPRVIYVNDPRRTNDKYEFTGNEIRTSKYTFITFLPKNLFTQFHRVAYLYFLVIAALNQLPPLAVFGRTASLFPLLFVLFVTAIKDGYEDWRRHRSDRKENNREALVLNSGEFRMKKWKHICVGEVVKIDSDETIPCDIVLLGTSDPNGIAYIQTMNLDGESNLKTRYARQETVSMVLENLYTGLIRCEQPNRNIYEFTAAMEFNNTRVPLGQANIVLRGCQLKNTDWLIGVVVYAGQETKAMMNSTPSPSKSSKLESYMNRETLWLSLFLFAICACVAAGMGIWLINHADQLDKSPYYRKKYFGRENGKDFKYYGLGMEIFFSFLSSVIIFQIMIPISLYITMELVRLGQSYFMIGDRHMYDASSDSRFQCRSLNINEDLGQIRYVFSDKTGTLTENKMEFRRASIFGKDYGDSLQVTTVTSHEITSSGLLTNPKSEITIDSDLERLLRRDLTSEERIAAHEFFLTLSACNTVIPVPAGEPAISSCQINEVKSIVYQGESPDEQALVTAASAYGYTLVERTTGHIAIDIHGERIRLDVLGLHEFDSVRKRMSVVVRFPNNRVKVLVKGADNLMLSIINPENNSPLQNQILSQTQNHLTNYSSQGLRTLVIGSRDLNETEFNEWQDRYEEASTAIHDRTSKLRKAASLIECGLTLLGATGIEDKLQEGVPEAIESLRQAGIKVWVLTGDKQETAISIGLSCRLLTGDMDQIVVNGSSENECRRLLSEASVKYGIKSGDGFIRSGSVKKGSGGFDSNLRNNGGVSENRPLALIIDGTSLVYILEKDLENELFDLATSCKVVLCCRVAPLQKAGIVDLIKSRTCDMTLAIGDGANDVSMIQMADVGVGICGQEGRQAVMASDFAMGQFRFLKRLLLVHGHWNYQRVGYLVLYNFYRNAVFVLMLFWYILYTAYSATSALTDWSSVFYSLIYTSLPTIVVGVLDKDLSHKTLIHYPKLYQAGHRHEAYNMRLFWITMLDTLWQSLVIFYVPYFTFQTSTIDIWSLGSLWTLAVVVLVNVHLAMDTRRWVFITHAAIWGSIVITFISMVLIDSIPVFPNYGTIYNTGASVTYWITILLIIILALLPRFFGKLIYQMFWPSDIQIAREAEILKKLPRS